MPRCLVWKTTDECAGSTLKVSAAAGRRSRTRGSGEAGDAERGGDGQERGAREIHRGSSEEGCRDAAASLERTW
jgi:hypothetical protein